MFGTCFRLPSDVHLLEEQYKHLQSGLDAVVAQSAQDATRLHTLEEHCKRLEHGLEETAKKAAEDATRIAALEKGLEAVAAKLPSPWVSTAASAATAIGMTVLSGGSAGPAATAAAELPRLVMGALGARLR